MDWDASRVEVAIRSHQRPDNAYKTFQLIKAAGMARIFVYVEESQMAVTPGALCAMSL